MHLLQAQHHVTEFQVSMHHIALGREEETNTIMKIQHPMFPHTTSAVSKGAWDPHYSAEGKGDTRHHTQGVGVAPTLECSAHPSYALCTCLAVLQRP